MLKAKNIQKEYGQLRVLKGIDIELLKGEVVSLVGTSGAGKSTLLQIIGTLDTLDKGEIWFEEMAIHSLSSHSKAIFRNRTLGFVFQFHHLLPEFTALENVCMPAFIAGVSQQTAMKNAEDLLKQMGLWARASHKPGQLSGGEQQRVSVARALINQPKLVLADEPTGNLDTHNSEELYKMFFNLSREREVSFLIATHNMNLAAISDRILQIKDGLMVKDVKAETILEERRVVGNG
jgi:lipoprotein-releasing system ATP-binding protein